MAGITEKQERFAQIVASGKTYAEAYRESYKCEKSKIETVWENSSRLMADGKVSARVKELQSNTQRRNEATLDEVLQEMANWLRFDPADIMDESDCVKSIRQLPKKVRKSISEIRVQELYTNIDGHKIKTGEIKNIKFIDKRATADMFMKKFSQYIENHKVVIEDLSYLDELLKGIIK